MRLLWGFIVIVSTHQSKSSDTRPGSFYMHPGTMTSLSLGHAENLLSLIKACLKFQTQALMQSKVQEMRTSLLEMEA